METMTQYLFTIYQPDGEPPADLDLDGMMRELAAVNQRMRDAGVWVFAGGLALHPAHTATVVRRDVLITDGPYTEGKEHVGGITIVDVPDLDEALRWSRELATIIGLPIEVRPFRDPFDGA
jgi:hypothetical protein